MAFDDYSKDGKHCLIVLIDELEENGRLLDLNQPPPLTLQDMKPCHVLAAAILRAVETGGKIHVLVPAGSMPKNGETYFKKRLPHAPDAYRKRVIAALTPFGANYDPMLIEVMSTPS